MHRELRPKENGGLVAKAAVVLSRIVVRLVPPGADPLVHGDIKDLTDIANLFAECGVGVAGQQLVEVVIRGSEIVCADQHSV